MIYINIEVGCRVSKDGDRGISLGREKRIGNYG